ncbi:hypothetical protein [Mumia zhuanghuii]|nr:hypothetical protein [Mumia zhuanghuii]
MLLLRQQLRQAGLDEGKLDSRLEVQFSLMLRHEMAAAAVLE